MASTYRLPPRSLARLRMSEILDFQKLVVMHDHKGPDIFYGVRSNA